LTVADIRDALIGDGDSALAEEDANIAVTTIGPSIHFISFLQQIRPSKLDSQTLRSRVINGLSEWLLSASE
jgi:hypothetical protein